MFTRRALKYLMNIVGNSHKTRTKTSIDTQQEGKKKRDR